MPVFNFSLQRLMACALSSVIILDLSLCVFLILLLNGIILFIYSFKSKKEIKKKNDFNIIDSLFQLFPICFPLKF